MNWSHLRRLGEIDERTDRIDVITPTSYESDVVQLRRSYAQEMKDVLESGAYRLMSASPVLAAARKLSRDKLRVLAYHGVDNAETFDRQMAHLVANYTPVTSEQVMKAVQGGEPLPDLAAWVTFDDGEPSVVENGLPVLRDHGIPATMFVCPSVVDTNRPLWWQEVAGLLAAGASCSIGPEDFTVDNAESLIVQLKQVTNARRLEVLSELRTTASELVEVPQITTEQLGSFVEAGGDIGNHTWTHPCLDTCDEATQRKEIRLAHEWLEARFPDGLRTFAFPNGNWTNVAEQKLSDLGYDIGLLFDHRLADSGSSPLSMSRLRVNATTGIDRFAAILAGIHPIAHQVRTMSR